MGRFWIYMLECDNGAYYVGYTKNLVRRFRQHIDGTANVRYTRSFKPLRISQCWRLDGPVGSALKVEKLVKKAGHSLKLQLVREPSRLQNYAAARLESAPDISTFDAARVEEAARALAPEEVRTAPDPFASTPQEDARPSQRG